MASDTLTERDIEILRLLAAGKRLMDIADDMNYARATISEYAMTIRAKLGARTNEHAVAQAFRLGVLT